MLIQKLAFGALTFGFCLWVFLMALALPDITGAGDVGPAFLPETLAVAGMALAALYLGAVARGTDRAEGLASPRSAGFMMLFLAVVVAVRWIGLPLAAALGAAAGVALLERGRPVLALATGAAFWLLTRVVFGWALDVPLP